MYVITYVYMPCWVIILTLKYTFKENRNKAIHKATKLLNVILYNAILVKECHTLKKVPPPSPEVSKICNFEN